jgi:hypothetical protein
MILQNSAGGSVQRISKRNQGVPERVAGAFLRITCNLAKADQRLPEMTDEEIMAANAKAGGYDWINDPSEDVYR